jgi:ferritin-like metal-binding protein YciE
MRTPAAIPFLRRYSRVDHPPVLGPERDSGTGRELTNRRVRSSIDAEKDAETKGTIMALLTLETPTDLLQYQLRTALTMEADSLAALDELAKAAKSADIKKLFRHHAGETKEQIENLHRVFRLLELKDSTAPSPSTKGITKQAESLIGRSGTNLRDQVVLSCALGNEHYEMAVYEGLIIPTTVMGTHDVVALLQANLDQEAHTSEELQSMLHKLVT